MLEIVLDIRAFRPGCATLSDFAIDGTPDQMSEWTTQRVCLETIVMGLVTPIKQVLDLPEGMLPIDIKQEKVEKKQAAEAAEEAEEDDGDDELAAAETGPPKKKQRGNKRDTALRYRMVPNLMTRWEDPDKKTFTESQNVHIFFEWLVRDMDQNNMASLLDRQNIVGVRFVFVFVDTASDFRVNLARLIMQNQRAATSTREFNKRGDLSPEYDRKIKFRCYDPDDALGSGYERLIAINDLIRLMSNYSGYAAELCEQQDFEKMVASIDLRHFGHAVAVKKMKELKVCARQREDLVRPFDPNYKFFLDVYQRHRNKDLAMMPVPVLAVELPVNLKTVGPDLFLLELPFATLQRYINNTTQEVSVFDVAGTLLTHEVISEIVQQSTGIRRNHNKAQAKENEHVFNTKKREFEQRRAEMDRLWMVPENRTKPEVIKMRKLLHSHLMNEARMAFSTQQILPRSMLDGLRHTQNLDSMVSPIRLIARNLSVLGNHVASQLIDLTFTFHIASGGYILLHMMWSTLDQFSDRLKLRNHHIMVGGPGVSKSFLLQLVKKLLPLGFAVEENYSSQNADNVSNLLDGSHVVKLHDEQSPWMQMSRNNLPIAEKQRLNNQLSAMVNGTRSSRRNIMCTDPITGKRSFKSEVTYGETPEINLAASNYAIGDDAMADRFISHFMTVQFSEFALYDHMGAERDISDTFNEQMIRQAFHKKALAMMHAHKMETIGLPIPRPNTALVAFYARKMMRRFSSTNTNIQKGSPARAFEQIINTCSMIMYDYAWRMVWGDDVSPFAKGAKRSNQPDAEVLTANSKYDIAQNLLMVPYLVMCNEEAALLAITTHAPQILSPELSTVVARISTWCCFMPPTLFAEWVRYADYMYAVEIEIDRRKEAFAKYCQDFNTVKGIPGFDPKKVPLPDFGEPLYIPFNERPVIKEEMEDDNVFMNDSKMPKLEFQQRSTKGTAAPANEVGTSTSHDDDDIEGSSSSNKRQKTGNETPAKWVEAVTVSVRRDVNFFTGAGNVSRVWSDVHCPQWNTPQHDPQCKVCNPFAYMIPVQPRYGFILFPENTAFANGAHPQPAGKQVHFFPEKPRKLPDGKLVEITCINYMEVQTSLIKAIRDLAKYLFTCQNEVQKGENSSSLRLNEADYHYNVIQLKNTMLNVPWVDNIEGPFDEYQVALAFSPSHVHQWPKKAQPVLREAGGKVYLLTAIAVFDYSRLRQSFIDRDVCNMHTRERDVLIGTQISGAPHLLDVIRLKPREGKQLRALNPSHIKKNVARSMAYKGLLVNETARETVVDCDPELFFSAKMADEYEVDMNRFAPARVDKRVRAIYNKSEKLKGDSDYLSSQHYPTDFFGKDEDEIAKNKGKEKATV